MANYCKKSSLENIAAAIKTVSGDSHALTFPEQFVSSINNLELVEQKSTPNVLLHSDFTTYKVPKGRYDGGVISVTPETKTVTPTSTTQSVTASANKVLEQVIVSALPGFQILVGTYDVGSSVASSWTVSGITEFTPMGAVIVSTDTDYIYDGCVGVASEKLGSYYGVADGNSDPGGTMSSGIVLGANSVSITANFQYTYKYIIWGK